jgi:hypothetical protein
MEGKYLGSREPVRGWRGIREGSEVGIWLK